MRMGLSPGSLLEAAVSIAVAILMTVAGYEMLYGKAPSPMHDVAAPVQPAPSVGAKVAMPHVDEINA